MKYIIEIKKSDKALILQILKKLNTKPKELTIQQSKVIEALKFPALTANQNGDKSEK